MPNLCTYNYVMIPVVIAQKYAIYFANAVQFFFGLDCWGEVQATQTQGL
jgi:hypothetical protein